MFEFTSAKIDIIASALHSPAKWKTEVEIINDTGTAVELIVCNKE